MAATGLPTIPGLELEAEIGRGSFGVVHAARAADGRPVAVKVLHRALDEATRARFAAEVQVMGTLAWHPGIVAIVDAGEDAEGRPWIAMERLGGGSLGDLLRRDGPLPPDRVLRHGVEAAAALAVAHAAGLVHRDIKPDNLLLSAEGTVKLSDFGVALAAGAGQAHGTSGTLAFSAPELLDARPATVSSDVYGLGATLFTLLHGAPAFHRPTDESPAAMILRTVREPVPDLRGRGVPDPLVRVVERAMAKDPDERPASAGDVVKELLGAAQELGVAVPTPIGPGQPGPAAAGARPGATAARTATPSERRRAQRLQRVAGALAGVAALVIGVGVVTTSGFLEDAGPQEGAVAPADEAPEDEAPADEAPDLAEEPDDPVAEPAPPPEATDPALPGIGSGLGDPVALDGAAVAVAGDADVTFAVTTTQLVRIEGGTATATSPAAGVTAVDWDDQVLATLAGGTVSVHDPDDLTPTAAVEVGATDVAVAAGRVLATTPAGLVEVTADGPVPVGAPDGTAHVAAQGDVVWASDGGVTLVRLDPTAGTASTLVLRVRAIADVAVGPDGSALVVAADGRLLQVEPDGTFAEITAGGDVVGVAATDDGTVVALLGDGTASEVGAGRPPAPLDVPGTVATVAPAGPDVLIGTADPAGVRRLQP